MIGWMCKTCGAVYIQDKFRAEDCCKQDGESPEGRARRLYIYFKKPKTNIKLH